MPLLITHTFEFIEHMLLQNTLVSALLTGTVAALLSGVVGYFMVLRNLGFAAHALGHIGFAGAVGGQLIGLSPWAGQLGFTLFAAASMGLLGERVNKSDTAIGIVLAFSLGLGTLFLHFYTCYAAQANRTLFGSLLGISPALFYSMLAYSIISLIALAIIARPLLLTSLEAELAEAKGFSLRYISLVFLLITGIAVAEASQVVGVLLVSTLLVGPAATVLNGTHTISKGVLYTVMLSILIVWCGIGLAFVTNWPISFWISTLSLLSYLLSLLRLRTASNKK